MRPDERIQVEVTPRAGRDQIAGVVAGVVRVRVAAPPVEGRANEAVERLIARALGVPPSAVAVVTGHRSRHKQVVVDGWSAERVLAALGRS